MSTKTEAPPSKADSKPNGATKKEDEVDEQDTEVSALSPLAGCVLRVQGGAKLGDVVRAR